MISELVEHGWMFYVSHSGGKDSQAMYHVIRDQVPDGLITVVHADLGEVEWHGVQDHIRNTIAHPLHVVRAEKTFFDMVRRRAASRPDAPSWPSAQHRQCTSDLKRGPIEKFIRNNMKTRGLKLAVNCIGLRAEESSARSKAPVVRLNKSLSKAGREVINYLPIHGLTTRDVFDVIEDHGQDPFWAYEQNERLSCVFCIMGSRNDLQHGRRQRPELYQAYLDLEKETGWTMFQSGSLSEKA